MAVCQGNGSVALDGLMLTLTAPLTWVPLYLALIYMLVHNNSSWKEILLVVAFAALAGLLAGVITDEFIKPHFMRWRPTRDESLEGVVRVVRGYRGGRFGFCSSHAANTISLAIYISLVLRHRIITLTMVAWSLINCYTRIYLGVHFPSDVLAGLALGSVVGVLSYVTYYIVRQRTCSPMPYRPQYRFTATGYARTDLAIVLTVFVLTLIYSLFRSIVV